MSYQIIYGRMEAKKRKKRFRIRSNIGKKNIAVISCGLVLLLLVLMLVFPGNISLLRELLLPGDAEITAQALENMAEVIAQGESLQTALEAFCRQIIGGGA